MRSRLARLVVLVLGLGGLLGLSPPARADYVFSSAFVATVQLSSGLDYVCMPTTHAPLLLTFTLPCPPGNPLVVVLPLQDDPIPNTHIDWHHNRQAVSASTSVCVITTLATPDKPLPSGPSVCGFNSSGTISGWCDLAGGQWTGTIFNGHSFIVVNLHFNVVRRRFIADGHWFKPSDGQHGLLVITGEWIEPQSTVTPESCFNKTARTFTLVGTATAVSNPLL
jgi:hypothetical protein